MRCVVCGNARKSKRVDARYCSGVCRQRAYRARIRHPVAGVDPIPRETWWLPRPPRSRYPGAFPWTFEQRLYRLLGNPRTILHPFGGKAEHGVRVDLNPAVKPDVLADAHDLPFDDASFDAVVCDPPYSDHESRDMYGTGPVRQAEWMREAVRVTKPGGYVVTYHRTPPPAASRHPTRAAGRGAATDESRGACLPDQREARLALDRLAHVAG